MEQHVGLIYQQSIKHYLKEMKCILPLKDNQFEMLRS